MTHRYFNKLTVVGHLVQVNDDGTIDDMSTAENVIKSEEEAVEFIAKMKFEVQEFNAAQPNQVQEFNAAQPNRKQRLA